MKGIGEYSDEPQTSSVWGRSFPDTIEYQENEWFQGDVADELQTSRDQDQAFLGDTTEFQAYGRFRDVADDEENLEEGFEGAVEQLRDGEGTDEQEPGQYSFDGYADGELGVDDDDVQEFLYLLEDEETDYGLGGDGEDEDGEASYYGLIGDGEDKVEMGYRLGGYGGSDDDDDDSSSGSGEDDGEGTSSRSGGDDDNDNDEDEGADYGDQGQDDDYAGSEPGGYDGEYQQLYYRQDAGDEDGDEGPDYYSGEDQ